MIVIAFVLSLVDKHSRMKQLTINIPEDKIDFFMELFENLGISTSEDLEVPKWQVNETQRRMDLLDKDKIKSRSWDDAKNDIFKKK